ncbi:protein phosphatase 2C domain-containing protein [Arthrobacter sp. Br18]|uniref:PP2C family protein-serine/threonine phosphatase n=1 Tax=Arthrobacter sp. Br18 TaxID=1312954 RepID=UPI0004ACC43F|nr:protein phosphatase 2C domain-containing protein [Arthrobacter sp. Br18]
MTNAPDAVRAAPRRVRLTYGFATDRGLRRELNEDSLIAAEPIFAVADGMGGHEAGEIASGVCVRTLGRSSIIGSRTPGFSVEDLEQLIQEMDAAIRAETGGAAGTTVSGVVVVQDSGAPCWLFFNVGDSRTYRLSGDRFGQVSIDHSEVQELVELGEITPAQAHTHPRRHVVTRALGTGDDAEADYWLMPVGKDDRILICSDGLSGEVSDDGIYDVLSTIPDPQLAADALIEATLRSGARDNVTVIVLDAIEEDASLEEVSADRGGAGPSDPDDPVRRTPPGTIIEADRPSV